jgi:hypothetical protein
LTGAEFGFYVGDTLHETFHPECLSVKWGRP